MRLFPEAGRPRGKRTYSEFARQTELEVACVFRRYPRSDPRPEEVPFYPYLPPFNAHSPPRVNFNLGFNPFAIN